MTMIRCGLRDRLDVSIYAKPEFDWLQMLEICKGLKEGLDVSVYAKPDLNWKKMVQIREGLMHR